MDTLEKVGRLFPPVKISLRCFGFPACRLYQKNAEVNIAFNCVLYASWRVPFYEELNAEESHGRTSCRETVYTVEHIVWEEEMVKWALMT